jgi:hypothetical protein
MTMSFELLIALAIMIIYSGLMVFAFFHFRKNPDTISADPAKRFRKEMNKL